MTETVPWAIVVVSVFTIFYGLWKHHRDQNEIFEAPPPNYPTKEEIERGQAALERLANSDG